MSHRVSKDVLGVRLDDFSALTALETVRSWLNAKKISPKVIVTIGPEFLLTAQKKDEFRQILNQANMALPEGFGLQLYAGIKNRVPGRLFMEDLCREAAKNNWSIGLVGGWAGDGEKAVAKLRQKFPGIKVSLVVDGEKATAIKNGSDIESKIRNGIDILFVGFGHPYQEKVLARSKDWFRVGMGVGGAIDYLAGRYPEPPKFLQSIGFEWFWRLLTQPWRFGRILRATFVFPVVLLLNRGKIRT